MSTVLDIVAMGAQGDGIAEAPRGRVFVPFTLPGERVNAIVSGERADLLSVAEPSPLRVAPACRHFGICGGCSLQHMESAAYLEWKREKVQEALSRAGVETSVDDIVACPPHSRRRIVLSARRRAGGMLLGFNGALSNEIVEIEECPVSLPEIVAALPVLRTMAEAICRTRDAFRMAVTMTDTGLDVAVEGSGRLEGPERLAATRTALELRLARLSLDGEILVERVKPQIAIGTTTVAPPPGAFLQAVPEAETAMVALVAGHFAKSKRVADLFAGVGTFALRLAERSEVHAVEGEQPALDALDRAFRFGKQLRRVTTERRDLFRRPLTFKELNAYDGVVFDPPRAGAEDQSRQIARSDVPKVAAVSCNPVTLGRDLAILVEGGYRLVSVTPVDQFVWSHHVEAVALLEKPKRRR
jgi:23S rRNA (uracil1939-C5)-methyltransferase